MECDLHNKLIKASIIFARSLLSIFFWRLLNNIHALLMTQISRIKSVDCGSHFDRMKRVSKKRSHAFEGYLSSALSPAGRGGSGGECHWEFSIFLKEEDRG
jgi:hypothetical protein